MKCSNKESEQNMTDTLSDKEMTKVQDILIDQLHIQRAQITPEARIIADLQADSLDMVEIAMKAEEEFGLTLPDDEAEKIVTVDDLYEVVGKLLGRAR
jgi:acyl carrier protein